MCWGGGPRCIGAEAGAGGATVMGSGAGAGAGCSGGGGAVTTGALLPASQALISKLCLPGMIGGGGIPGPFFLIPPVWEEGAGFAG